MAKTEEKGPLCEYCKRPMVLGFDVPMCAWGCGTKLSGDNRGTHDLRPFNSRVWVGSQVYTPKQLRSDELRSDTEAAMLAGNGSGLKG